MEFWIYIVISVIGILIISLVAFIIRCFGYKKVVRKIRSLSMNSSQSHEDEEAGRREIVNMPAPPPYSISLQHPVIARSTAASQAPTQGTPTDEAQADGADVTLETQSQLIGAFPAEEFFMPPPYCLEPPSYTEVQEQLTTQSSDVTELEEPPLFSAH